NVASPTGSSPGGRLRPTVLVTVAVAPLMSTGCVSTETRPASSEDSPVTVATAGRMLVPATSKPSPGVPMTTAVTGTDLVVTGELTAIRTRTDDGLMSTGERTSSRASTATRSTS